LEYDEDRLPRVELFVDPLRVLGQERRYLPGNITEWGLPESLTNILPKLDREIGKPGG
jgi:hypothetical protein